MSVVYPGPQPGRGVRIGSWWGKAWQRAVEEAAYEIRDLRTARAFLRAGGLGSIAVEPGAATGTVEVGDDAYVTRILLPELESGDALIEVIAAQAGRIGSLLAGDLPHDLVEHAEAAGVEVLPFGAEFEARCSCEPWLDPCAHSLAVLLHLGRLIDTDPFVLLHLRGLSRETVLARLHDRAAPAAQAPDAEEAALDLAADAVRRAAELMRQVDQGIDPPDRLW